MNSRDKLIAIIVICLLVAAGFQFHWWSRIGGNVNLENKSASLRIR